MIFYVFFKIGENIDDFESNLSYFGKKNLTLVFKRLPFLSKKLRKIVKILILTLPPGTPG
jgi:hypothetical protein